MQKLVAAGLSRKAAVKEVEKAEVDSRGRVRVAHAFSRRFDDAALAKLGRIGRVLAVGQ